MDILIGLPEKRFYVYTLAYPDEKVFYVGKGSKRSTFYGVIDRIDEHEKEAKKSIETIKKERYNLEKCLAIQSIWRDGGQVRKKKVYETDVEQDAYLYEWVLIYMVYGIDNLTNSQSGGGRSSIKDYVAARVGVNDDEMLESINAGAIIGITSTELIQLMENGFVRGYLIGPARQPRFRRGDIEQYLKATHQKK